MVRDSDFLVIHGCIAGRELCRDWLTRRHPATFRRGLTEAIDVDALLQMSTVSVEFRDAEVRVA